MQLKLGVSKSRSLFLLLLVLVGGASFISPTRTCRTPSLSTTKPLKMTESSVKSGSPVPKLALPPPICSTTPGTWAYDTMSRRIDSEILQRTYEENEGTWQLPEFKSVLKRFQELRLQLQNAATTKLSYLDDLPDDASSERKREYEEWTALLQPYVDAGDTWLSAPWMVAEFYVYRRLMQALGYWDASSPGFNYDPFAKAKRAGLDTSPGSAEVMLQKVPTLPKTREGVALAAAFALWGNKMDLSIWPANATNSNVDVFSDILAQATGNLLHDDTHILQDHCDMLRSKGGGNVDIIVDNAGFELVTDLALAQHLVESGIAKCVTFQLKSHPTFVSDALEKDLLETVDLYVNLDWVTFPNAQRAGKTWREFLDNGQWKCDENNFWVQPYAMWEMTEPLRSGMSTRCDLAFVKGDANYRRLLGDRIWEYTDPFQDVVGHYFPCPVCALRTLKAEIGCGMDADQIQRASALDDNWLVSGRFGVVQFGTGAAATKSNKE